MPVPSMIGCRSSASPRSLWLIDLAFFGTLRNGGPADVQRRCRDPATLQALQLRVAGYADLSLRQHHSCAFQPKVRVDVHYKSGAERDRRQRSPEHLFLPECYPGVVRINEHDVFDHLRDSSSPCERALPNSYLLTSWLCRRFQGLGNYSCVLPRILLSESLC